ncbi:MAG: PilZ domain-containing protein [Chromatiales bacterium]|nr:PilZ domain-containing protein [Chromatiales bacterium]
MTETDIVEKRRFSRIPFAANVDIITDTQFVQGRLIDVSLQGALVEPPADWEPPDSLFTIKLILDSGPTCIKMDVRLAHREESLIGLHCEHIDLDSIIALRRLVELNLGNSELLHRELAALG